MTEGSDWQSVCDAGALVEGGDGVRFTVQTADAGALDAFAVRYQGRVRAYLNRCSHVPIELDWIEGHFFDNDPRYLVCATHGALYDSGTGACVSGPCAGRGLVALETCETEGTVFVRPAGVPGRA